MITVIGKAVESEYVKLGGVEIYPKQIIIESLSAPLPIDREARKGHERSSIDQRIDYRWIDLRTDANQLMFKAQTVMINAMREFLLARRFMEIHTGSSSARRANPARTCSRSSISTARRIWRRACSSTSRWRWPPGFESASSRWGRCSARRSPSPASTRPNSPASIWSSATSNPSAT